MKKNNSKRPKFGIVVQYYGLRADIPLFLEALSNTCDLVLFARKEDLEKIETSHPKRTLPALPNSIRNKFWTFLYQIAGNIPKSKKANFRNWREQLINASSQGNRSFRKRIKLKFILEARLLFAGLLKFDNYLNRLSFDCKTKTDDIDVFLAMSDVYDVNFLGCILKSKKPVLFYIYSWDHPAKHFKFSNEVSRYLTWHSGISKDLIDLHQINNSIITELGSTQLSLVFDFKETQTSNQDQVTNPKVVYYACGWDDNGLKQEFQLIRWLSETLLNVDPNVHLIVRPYPNVKFFEVYKRLSRIPNITIENIEFSESGCKFHKDSHIEKYQKICAADIVVHCGTTLGLEAAYFATPVIFLAPEDLEYGQKKSTPDHLTKCFQQHHLQKYMLASKTRNIVRNKLELEQLLKDALANPDDFLTYNHELSDSIPLKGIDDIATQVIEIAQELIS